MTVNSSGLDVFGAGIEVRPLKEPGICFLCEATPMQDSERVINTMRYFIPGPLTKLNGTKYVCEGCAKDLGAAIGMVSKDKYDDVAELAYSLTEELKVQDAKLKAFASLEAAVAELTPKPEVVEA